MPAGVSPTIISGRPVKINISSLAIWKLPGNLAITGNLEIIAWQSGNCLAIWQLTGNHYVRISTILRSLAIAWQFGNCQAIWQLLPGNQAIARQVGKLLPGNHANGRQYRRLFRKYLYCLFAMKYVWDFIVDSRRN